MNWPKISIVTPSFNQGQFLEETIDSVLLQDYPNLEYIIIDGGSTDNFIEIIKKHSHHLSYWVSEADNGQSHAINKGLQHCTGEVFNWLNSDDYYEPNALKHVAQIFMSKNCHIYSGISRVFDKRGTKFLSTGTDLYPDSLAKTIGRARIDQPETFWDLSVLNSLLPLNENLHFLMDRDLWVRYLLRYGQERVEKDSSLLVHFRHHLDSKTIFSSSNFGAERNGYFIALARYAKRDIGNIAEIIEHENVAISEWKVDIPEEFLHNSLDHFLLLIAEEFYASRKMMSFFEIVDEINKSALNLEDNTRLRKLIWRARFGSWLYKS